MPLAALRVDAPGLLTTVQDGGRPGYQSQGVPVSGAMDPFALQVANLLVGNPRGEAALEITLLGPSLHVLRDCVVAVCGADLSPHLDGVPLPLWKSVGLRAGQALGFGAPRAGARAYLAVAGGFAVPLVLGSRSTFLRGRWGGSGGRALRAGDVLEIGEPARALSALTGRALSLSLVPAYPQEAVVRVLLGPQEDAFTPAGLATFLSAVYEVTHQSDRMGYRLAGPPIEHTPGRTEMLSEAVPLGAIQVPAGGQPLILMADRQTVGGYPKIATVISGDLPAVAQLAPGRRIAFRQTTLPEAQAFLLARERLLTLLEAALV
ncbi:MAG: biotin-dependent carboxyltransferase family protein [Armatimonadetes bacterium]|nr:biotin-dependent carboxyltransferase family protein [Armatimonadota bacterium]